MIKETVNTRLATDEISNVLGTPDYIFRFYSPALSQRIYPHTKEHVIVTRFYLTLDPKVIVDFEPHPLDGLFHLEAKQDFFMSLGYVYVPVYLIDRLTQAQFAERVAEAREALRSGEWRKKLDASLSEVEIDGLVASPDATRWIDNEVNARYDKFKAEHEKPYTLKGFIEQKKLQAIKREVMVELRERMRKQHGRLGVFDSTRELAVSTR